MIFTVIGKKAVYQVNAASYSAAVEALVAAGIEVQAIHSVDDE